MQLSFTKLAPVALVLIGTPLLIWMIDRAQSTSAANSPSQRVWQANAARIAELSAMAADGDIEALQREAASSDPMAQTALGLMLCELGETEEAELQFAAAMARDYPPAMVYAIVLAAPRVDSLADPIEARRLRSLLPMFAETTAVTIADSFIDGPCLEPADRDWAGWFMDRLGTGDPDGLLSLAAAYESGGELPQNPVEAYGLAMALERYHDSWLAPPPPESNRIERLRAQLSPAEQHQASRRADAWYSLLTP